MELLFAKRLKELRLAKKMTQANLAEVLNYGYTAIANYEAGKNQPSYKDLLTISEYFDVSVDYLLGASNTYCGYCGDICIKDFIMYVPNEVKITVFTLINQITSQYMK